MQILDLAVSFITLIALGFDLFVQHITTNFVLCLRSHEAEIKCQAGLRFHLRLGVHFQDHVVVRRINFLAPAEFMQAASSRKESL